MSSLKVVEKKTNASFLISFDLIFLISFDLIYEKGLTSIQKVSTQNAVLHI